jgi:predicted transposase YbfD/YdcC
LNFTLNSPKTIFRTEFQIEISNHYEAITHEEEEAERSNNHSSPFKGLKKELNKNHGRERGKGRRRRQEHPIIGKRKMGALVVRFKR